MLLINVQYDLGLPDVNLIRPINICLKSKRCLVIVYQCNVKYVTLYIYMFLKCCNYSIEQWNFLWKTSHLLWYSQNHSSMLHTLEVQYFTLDFTDARCLTSSTRNTVPQKKQILFYMLLHKCSIKECIVICMFCC